MRVQLVTATTSGGAGRAAQRLQDALERHGLHTEMSVQRNPGKKSSQLKGGPLPWWVSPGISRPVSYTHLTLPTIYSV